MLKIRFNRVGKKNKAYFRIVLQESSVAPGGRHIEILGSWDPHLKRGVFKDEKIREWIKKGAQVSDSVWNLLIKQGIIEGKKRIIKIAKKKEESKEDVKAEENKVVEENKSEELKEETKQ